MPDGWSLVAPAQNANGWTPVVKPVSAEDFTTSAAQPDGSALSRFASNAGAMLNPVTAVEGVAHAVAHPLDTAKAAFDASMEQFEKAKAMGKEGRYTEALGHLGGIIPIIGPAAAAAGEQIASGDVAGGLGKAVGLLAPSAALPAARLATGAVPSGLRASIADSLAAKAAGQVADVMAPKVGANKTQFGGMAETVAPALAADPEMGALSRQGLHGTVGAKLAAAEQALDEANDARLSARTFATKPLIDSLLEKRRALTAESVDASKATPTVTERTSPILDASGKPTTVTTTSATPAGRDVIPAPNRARVAQIDQAISELKTLGADARYEDLRKIRQAYDGPAKAVYSPSMTADFLAKKGESLGAADVTGTLRDHLAKMDPQTAAANAQYSLYKTAHDVLDATAEVERVRPTVGRRIIARMAGTIIGEQGGGVAGAVAGYALGPMVDAVASSGWTTQLKTAQLLSKLATAIRSGDEGFVTSLTAQLKSLKKLAPQAGILTNPTGLQTTTAPAR